MHCKTIHNTRYLSHRRNSEELRFSTAKVDAVDKLSRAKRMAGEGRKSVKGQRRKPKQFKSDGHSFELKLSVLKTLDTATMKERIEKFFPALPAAKRQTKHRNIDRSRQQRAKIERMAA